MPVSLSLVPYHSLFSKRSAMPVLLDCLSKSPSYYVIDEFSVMTLRLDLETGCMGFYVCVKCVRRISKLLNSE